MKRGWVIAAAIPLALALALLAGGRHGAFTGTPPADLGLREGRLKPPSPTSNSVSSQTALHTASNPPASARINPLPLRGSGEESLARLRGVLEATEGVRVVLVDPGYLRAEATTRWLRFVDDLEFWLDPVDGLIHLRSASRVGRNDFGANRARIEAIRARYLGLGPKPD